MTRIYRAHRSTNGVAQASALSGTDFILIFLRQKWIILAVVVLCVLAGALVVTLTTRKYEVAVIAYPVEGQSGVQQTFASTISTLGFLDNGNINERKHVALATLQARSFLEGFIRDNNLLPVLFADRWDANRGTWRAGVKPPTLEDGYEALRKTMRIDDDTAHGVVWLYVKWTNAATAAEWANALVRKVNELLQAKAVARSDAMLKYLNDEYSRTTIQELRTNIANLIEQEIKERMMAKSRDDYALSVIDPAEPTSAPVEPRILLVMAASLLLGLFIGVPVAFFRESLLRSGATMPSSAPEDRRARAL
ncbi:MAG TPA: GNVR domain-containing protein [Stellaceae bacterium]|nr:GNVR domain-containing protein [Stellaceae bacterium]